MKCLPHKNCSSNVVEIISNCGHSWQSDVEGSIKEESELEWPAENSKLKMTICDFCSYIKLVPRTQCFAIFHLRKAETLFEGRSSTVNFRWKAVRMRPKNRVHASNVSTICYPNKINEAWKNRLSQWEVLNQRQRCIDRYATTTLINHQLKKWNKI